MPSWRAGGREGRREMCILTCQDKVGKEGGREGGREGGVKSVCSQVRMSFASSGGK